MSIAILVGGTSEHGNVQHRYLVDQFLERFDDRVLCIISERPQQDPWYRRVRRLVKRGNYGERIARALYPGGYGPSDADLQPLLLPDEADPHMRGGDRHHVVESHNGQACENLIDRYQPDVIVVYGTRIIRSNIFERAKQITLNMHTGLSPFYRGDSTLFWPVYYNDPAHLGVTVHELVASVDGGAIAATAPVEYAPGDNEAALFAKGVIAGVRIYLDAVEQALDGSLVCTAQDLSKGREFRWIHRTVAAEKAVLSRLDEWARARA